jgi:hypothetical protein
MTSYAKPILNPEGELNPTFNSNYFNHNGAYATLGDLLNYGNLFNPNNWTDVNTFSAINSQLINGITDTAFSYITYLPNIITELTNISYAENTDFTSINSNTTIISGNTQLSEVGIYDNLNVGTNINVNSIVNTNLLNQNITTNNLSCNQIKINNVLFNDTGCFIYINGLSMPIIKSTLIQNFNIQSITSMYITVKPAYRIDFVDVNNIILFSMTNTSDNYIYYIQVPYNTNMITANFYNNFNILL